MVWKKHGSCVQGCFTLSLVLLHLFLCLPENRTPQPIHLGLYRPPSPSVHQLPSPSAANTLPHPPEAEAVISTNPSSPLGRIRPERDGLHTMLSLSGVTSTIATAQTSSAGQQELQEMVTRYLGCLHTSNSQFLFPWHKQWAWDNTD